MKTFNDKEIIQLKEYLSSVIGNPTPFAKQKSIFRSDGFCQWCDEWELIEMLKYLINGKDNYYADPIPNRLRKSDVFPGKKFIEEKVIKSFDSYGSVDEIINHFKRIRGAYHESA
jgi:hypothetical protein